MQSQRPVMRQEQRLRMTPQLYQAIKIMSLPLQDLRMTIAEELEQNPALEAVGDNSVVSLDEMGSRPKDDADDYFDDSSDLGYTQSRSDTGEDKKRQFMEGVLTRPESLHDHLLWQLRVHPIPPRGYEIGELLINNLDDNGFHIEPPESLVRAEDRQLMYDVARLIQGLDPVGVCTADYREALLVQIKLSPDAPERSYELVEKHIELMERGKHSEMAKKLGVNEEDVDEILSFVRTLEPFPGRKFSADTPLYVVPDVRVRYQDGEFTIALNDDNIPVLRVSPFFNRLTRRRDEGGKDVKQYVTANVQRAKWFMRSIHQRNETMLRVTQAIVEFQRDFFRRGAKYLAPLTLRDIAQEVGVHEATVSRTTNGKYVQTEFGILELKYFFTNSISGPGPDGSRYSKVGVKQIIKEIIEEEGEAVQLSDKKITDILARRGISIARRTVAKYRKELDIDSSYRR